MFYKQSYSDIMFFFHLLGCLPIVFKPVFLQYIEFYYSDVGWLYTSIHEIILILLVGYLESNSDNLYVGLVIITNRQLI